MHDSIILYSIYSILEEKKLTNIFFFFFFEENYIEPMRSNSLKVSWPLSHHEKITDIKLMEHCVVSYFHAIYFRFMPVRACILGMELLIL